MNVNANGAGNIIGLMGMAQKWMSDGGGKITQSLGGVNKPAETIMLAERLHVWTNQATFPGNLLIWGPGCFVSGVNWWDSFGSPSLIPDGTRAQPADPNDPTGPNGSILPRHSGKANFAFADGHVKALDPKATNPDPVNRPQDNMWDATRQ
jgi:prepilin-type processing-associated H-X9-DG protein